MAAAKVNLKAGNTHLPNTDKCLGHHVTMVTSVSLLAGVGKTCTCLARLALYTRPVLNSTRWWLESRSPSVTGHSHDGVASVSASGLELSTSLFTQISEKAEQHVDQGCLALKIFTWWSYFCSTIRMGAFCFYFFWNIWKSRAKCDDYRLIFFKN